MSNKLEIIQSAQTIRIWCKNNLPFYESVVGYDLIIYIAIEHLKSERISVKQIFDSLPHSYTAIRQHYMRLIKDGWIECIGDEKDRRVKRVSPTKKFEEIITEYAKIIVSNTPPTLISYLKSTLQALNAPRHRATQQRSAQTAYRRCMQVCIFL